MRYLLLLLLLLATPTTGYAQTPAPTRWEYGRLTVQSAGGLDLPSMWVVGDSIMKPPRPPGESKNDPLGRVLQELGNQGWEFVAAVPGVGLIFKRPGR
jgi:hypothetical protein